MLTILAVIPVVVSSLPQCECYSKDIYRCSHLPANTTLIPFIPECRNKYNTLIITNSNIRVLSGQMFNLLPFRRGVQKLYLTRNQIKVINEDAFKNFTNLTELDLSHNVLNESQIVKSVCLNATLKRLHLDENPIEEMSSETFNCPVQAISILSLQILTITGCGIRNIAENTFFDFEKLTDLDLDRNKLTNLKLLEPLSGLRNLSLAYNNIQDVSIFNRSANNSLVSLCLDGNPVTMPKTGFLSSLQQLQCLSMQNMPKMAALPPLNLKALQTLQIGGNKFSVRDTDAFQNIRGLRTLNMTGVNLGDMSDKKLEKLFNPLANLTTLVLTNTTLKEKVGNTFKSKPHLTYLDVSQNHISDMSNSFRISHRIDTLLLNKNNIRFVDPKDLPQNISQKLDLSGNPFDCTCALAPFRVDYIPKHKDIIDIYSTNTYFCNGPRGFREKPLKDYNPTYIECHGFNRVVITALVLCVVLIFITCVIVVIYSNKQRISKYLQARKLKYQYSKI